LHSWKSARLITAGLKYSKLVTTRDPYAVQSMRRLRSDEPEMNTPMK